MKLTFKKTLIACALPLLLAACNDDSDSDPVQENPIDLTGIWVGEKSGTYDASINIYTCVDTYHFTGEQFTKDIDCSSTNGDKAKVTQSGTFSTTKKDEGSNHIDLIFENQNGFYTKNGVDPEELNNDTLYNKESPELGKMINGKVQLGIFKIENDSLKLEIDGDYRARGEEESVRPTSFSDYSTDYIELNKKSHVLAPDETYTNGVLADLGDPYILKHDGTYYMYGTDDKGGSLNIPVYTSKDLVNWTSKGVALSKDDSWGDRWFWAPEVIHKDDLFYMYYAVNEKLAVATSQSPLGPFKQGTQGTIDLNSPELPQHPNGGEIDAHIYMEAGKYYIYFVNFMINSNGDRYGNEIWGAELNADMKTIDKSTLKLIMQPTQDWELIDGQINEGPFLIKEHGKYYMTYSGNNFYSRFYGVGYATADTPLGDYKKYKGNPILQSNEKVQGAGHHSIIDSPDGTELFMVYHTHNSLDNTGPRRISIDRMWFDEDILRVEGPSITRQPLPSNSPVIKKTEL